MYPRHPSRAHGVAALAGALAVTATLLGFGAPAKAETSEELQAKATELQGRIESSAADYDAAMAKVADLQRQADENQARIDEVQAQIPAQRERSAAAIRALYKMDQNTPGLIELILSSEDFNDLIATLTYLNAIESSNLKEAERLGDLEDELTRNQAELEAAREQADQERDEASRALADAQAAREEAQRAADEQAAREEAERQAAIAAERAAAAEADGKVAGAAQSTPQATSANVPATSSPTKVDWSDSKQSFVDQWAPRINAYLAGSPMAGTGETFASAAWDYGVDPRWSPAIANTESSKGAVCFKSHNAWGWGSSSWSSWDEAIRAHVAGLARGYGSTISMEAARRYCPPAAEHWYATTLAEMERI